MDERRSRKILEVGEDATLEEVSAAYQLLKRIHGCEQGIFGGAGMEEFSAEARQEALEEIEAAHAVLRSRFMAAAVPPEDAPQGCATGPRPELPAAEAPAGVPPREPEAPEAGPAPGEEDPPPSLRTPVWKARRESALTLDEVAAETHVPRAFLQALEEERFGDLPLAPVHVRGYLSAFLRAVNADPDALVPAYMERYQAWQGHR